MKYCIVCKQTYYPGINRSFYNFPKADTVNRSKWLLALGRESVSKHTHVCSAHFDDSSFRNNNIKDCTRTNRLKPDAVPSLRLTASVPVFTNCICIDSPKNKVKNSIASILTSDYNFHINGSSLDRAAVQGLEQTIVKTETLQLSNYDINYDSDLNRAATQDWKNTTIKTEELQISDSDINDGSSLEGIKNRVPTQGWEKSTIKTEDLQISDSDHDFGDGSRCVTEDMENLTENCESEYPIQDLLTNHQRSTKRKLDQNVIMDNRTGLIPYKKKLFYKSGNETLFIDGNDILFKSIRSYENFQECIAYQRKQVQYFRQKYERSTRKINSLKQILKKLKNAEKNS